MKKTALLLVLISTCLLTGCAAHQSITPIQLARLYTRCHQPYGAQLANCSAYQTELTELSTQLMSFSGQAALGQEILDTQCQLVTLQQEFDKKLNNVLERQNSLAAVKAKQRKILVLHAVFLLANAQ